MNWLTQLIRDRNYIAYDDTVLDIGCGLIHPGVFGRFHLGLDAFRPALEAIAEQIPTLHGTAPGVLHQFVDRSFDVVLLLDIVEHMEKEKAFETVVEAERIARKRVVIFTPQGYVVQHGYAHDGLPVNPREEHRCGFEVHELKSIGYDDLTIYPNGAPHHGPCKSILATKVIGT